MGWSTTILVCLVFAAAAIATVNCNAEGDALHAWKSKLADPYMVLQSWDPTLVNPCTWFHVTCNIDNSVTRVDLGSAGLSGPLIPELQYLTNLQYLEVFDNSLNGSIPIEFGNLRGLISLDLYQNKLSGNIPSTLGNLLSLRFMRFHSNMLSGRIPTKVIQLILWGNLEIMDLSDNMLAGRVRSTNSTGFAITKVVQDPRAHK